MQHLTSYRTSGWPITAPLRPTRRATLLRPLVAAVMRRIADRLDGPAGTADTLTTCA